MLEKPEAKNSKELSPEQKDDARQILNELKEQQKRQEQLIQEQKNIIQELKQHQKEDHANRVNMSSIGKDPLFLLDYFFLND